MRAAACATLSLLASAAAQNAWHYGDQDKGCKGRYGNPAEEPIKVVDMKDRTTFSVCTAPCLPGKHLCPTDVPPGTTAAPSCQIQMGIGYFYCGLPCNSTDQCAHQLGAECLPMKDATQTYVNYCLWPDGGHAKVAAPPAPIDVDFSCTKANPVATDVKVDISPNPPVPGQDLTVSLSATLGKDLPNMTATVTVSVKVSILPKINIGPLAVPIAISPAPQKGPIAAAIGPIALPADKLPVSGTIDLTVDVSDGSGGEVLCFSVKAGI